jgi:Asp-tRNA(Asn)/Glu-tRNA(Gln) amidotransferase A subunit family amidase
VKGLYCFAGDPLNILKDISTRDAEVIRRCNSTPNNLKQSNKKFRLREAGAILLTTSNMAESMETENDVFGRTNNPYDSRRTAGGSSGGEGALVASAGSPFGIGNDLGGSIRVPATFCGVFGLKPTAGMFFIIQQFA